MVLSMSARLLAGAASVLLALGGAAAVPASAADPMTGAPKAGDCFDITVKQALAPSISEASVACSGDHTLVTTKVVKLPARVKPTDYEAIGRFADCGSATAKAVGVNPLFRALTLHTTFLFVPTAAQRSQGAHWASCHVGVRDTKGLNDLPSPLARATRKPADSVATCIAGRSQYVTCAEKHRSRAVAAAYVKASGSDRAVAKKVGAVAGGICQKRTGNARGSFTHVRLTPAKVVLTCFERTTR